MYMTKKILAEGRKGFIIDSAHLPKSAVSTSADVTLPIAAAHLRETLAKALVAIAEALARTLNFVLRTSCQEMWCCCATAQQVLLQSL